MGDHIAYYRTAPGDEDLAFVRIARAIIPHCEAFHWHDDQSRSKSQGKQKGVKSQKRLYNSNRVTLNDTLKTDITSLSDMELARQIATITSNYPRWVYFDGQVRSGPDLTGYVGLYLYSKHPKFRAFQPAYHLYLVFRLFTSPTMEDSDLNGQATALRLVCGDLSGATPIEQIEHCLITREGVEIKPTSALSIYDKHIRNIAGRLNDFVRSIIHIETNLVGQRLLGLLQPLNDSELLEWYLKIVSRLPEFEAWKTSGGVMTTTTSRFGMNDLYMALMDSLNSASRGDYSEFPGKAKK